MRPSYSARPEVWCSENAGSPVTMKSSTTQMTGPTGRVIGRARIEGSRITAFDILIGEKGPAGELRQGTWDVRPVDLRQGPDEALYVSDDMGGRVLKIGYEP